MYSHSGTDAALVFTEVPNGFSHWISFFIREFEQIGPILFFMMPGIFFLSKDEDLGTLFKHRILRYVVVIILFSLFQRLYWAVASGAFNEFSLMDSLKTMYSTSVIAQYWFLYAYLGMLIMFPFIRMIAKELTKTTALYLFALLLIFGEFFPIFEIIFDLGRINLSPEILANIIIWPLMGYSVDHIFSDELEKVRNRLAIYLIGVGAFLINFVYTHRVFRVSGAFTDIGATYTLTALAVLVFARQIAGKREFKEGTAKILKICGEGIFLVYLLEPQLRTAFRFVFLGLKPVITWFPAAVIWTLIAVAFGIMLSFFLRLIPGVKKFI